MKWIPACSGSMGTQYYTFFSGRRWSTNNGDIGINPNHDIFISGQQTYFCEDMAQYNKDGYQPLTPEERVELSEYMIGLWQRFKEVTNATNKKT